MIDKLVIHVDKFITLGQVLKEINMIDSGGQAKYFLQEVSVYVNGDEEKRRGRKLYPGDQIDIKEEEVSIQIDALVYHNNHHEN